MTKTFRFSLLMLAFAATPVLAGAPEPATGRIVVRTADLDLGKHSDRRLLDQRLAEAIALACGTASNVDLAGRNEVRRCLRVTREMLASERDQRIAAASDRPILLAGR